MEALVGVSLLLLLVVVAVTAWWSYRRHKRVADARSRAALNRLLAEADEIAQAAKAEGAANEGLGPGAPDDPDAPSGGQPPTHP